jgi:hypothetical protein
MSQDINASWGSGLKVGTDAGQLLGFYGKEPAAKPAVLTTTKTTITHTAPGTPDFAIQNLTSSSPFGFVTADEGNTVLSVIVNLQARVNELESRLQGIGLLT